MRWLGSGRRAGRSRCARVERALSLAALPLALAARLLAVPRLELPYVPCMPLTVCTAALLASVQDTAEEPAVLEEQEFSHQGRVFTMLHNAAALAAFCKHIGKVRKSPVSPCPPGATHPCCTQRQLQMAKMQGSTPTNFNWADPSSWSGAKGTAAAHLSHKASTSAMAGMSAPGAATEWQSTAPAPQPPTMQQPPPQQAMYQQPMYQQPPQQQQPMYAQQPQPGYYPHLLPGQPGVPEVCESVCGLCVKHGCGRVHVLGSVCVADADVGARRAGHTRRHRTSKSMLLSSSSRCSSRCSSR